MSKLNKDILFLLFEELQNDSKSLFSFSLVNRLWCETVIPILWKNPWCHVNRQKSETWYNLIIVSLPNDVKESLKSQGSQLSILHQPPLFDYLSFCKSINIEVLRNLISRPLNYFLTREQSLLLRQEIYCLF